MVEWLWHVYTIWLVRCPSMGVYLVPSAPSRIHLPGNFQSRALKSFLYLCRTSNSFATECLSAPNPLRLRT